MGGEGAEHLKHHDEHVLTKCWAYVLFEAWAVCHLQYACRIQKV